MKIKKFISYILVFALLTSRVFFAYLPAVGAVDAPPPPPTVGAPPSIESVGPPPSVQSVPTVPPPPAGGSSPAPTTALTSSPTIGQPSPTGSDASSTVGPTSTPFGVTPSPSETTTDPSSSPTSEVNPETVGTEADQSGDSNAVNDPANISTGPSSQNQSSETLEQKMETLNKNLAEVQNKVSNISSSGFNHADYNTLAGQVFTGDSNTSYNLLNKLNSNITGTGGFSVFNIYDNYTGDIVFNLASNNLTGSFDTASSTVSKNVLTGPGSTNNADASDSFIVKEANGNDAKLVNDIFLQSSTGGNSASYNTGGGVIKTGNASATGNIVNLANTNINVSQWLFGVVNIFGTLAGNIILPKDAGSSGSTNPGTTVLTENNNTGPQSDNSSNYENTTAATFENNNSAQVTSNVDAIANSGNNSASVNTGGGSVVTGSTDTAVSNTTIANSNTVNEDGTVWMVIVNEAGKWVGHILGDPWGVNTASNSLPLTTTTGGSGTQSFSTTSQNSATGPLSDNNASFSSVSDETINSTNNAAIENNIKAIADSGNNKASYNTGAGQIETGDAKVSLNLMNMANTNVLAKKFVVVFVNVLGSFLGDVVPPDQQATNLAVTPTPTFEQVISDDTNSAENDSRVGSTEELSEEGLTDVSYTSDDQSQYASTPFSDYDYQAPAEQVNYQNRKVTTRRQYTNVMQPTGYYPVNNSINYQRTVARGTFLSPAFAKATETTFPGILLGGARLNVSQSWLSIVPLAILLILIRRRRKIQFTKYLNALLEVVL